MTTSVPFRGGMADIRYKTYSEPDVGLAYVDWEFIDFADSPHRIDATESEVLVIQEYLNEKFAELRYEEDNYYSMLECEDD